MIRLPAPARRQIPPRLRHDPVREENRRLVARVQRLRAALDAAERENAALRREATQLRADNEQLRAGPRGPGGGARPLDAERTARMRVMLRDQHSRNP